MTVQSEDKRDAIDLLRAVVDEDPKRWLMFRNACTAGTARRNV